MRLLVILALAWGPVYGAEGDAADPKTEPPKKTITRADLERRIVSLENERNDFQKKIDTKIADYNTETDDLKQSAQELEQRGYSTNPPDQAALQEAQQKQTEAETRQEKRDSEVEPDVAYEKNQIKEREQKITKLRSEVDKMAAKDPQPQLPMPDMKPPGGEEDGGGDKDGSKPLPGEDLLMNDQRLDAAGRPTDMSREEMDARYGQEKGGSAAPAMRTGAQGGRYLDPRNKIAAAQMPNFTGGRGAGGSLGSGRPGSMGREDAAQVKRSARTGWIPGGKFQRPGLGGPIGGEGIMGGDHKGSSSWSRYGGSKKFRSPGESAKSAGKRGAGAGPGGRGASASAAGKPESLTDRLLRSMSEFKDKWLGGGSSGESGGASPDPSWANGSQGYDDAGLSPGRSLTGADEGYNEDGSRKGLPAYARSGAPLEEEGGTWLDRWPYILAVLMGIIGILIWKLDLH